MFEEYGKFWDVLYRDKDYTTDCVYLEGLFRQYGDQVRSILDLGCGTGGHAHVLAERGYSVTGVDQSQTMIEIATSKNRRQTPVTFCRADIRDLAAVPSRTFDAVIAMFAVFSYLKTNRDVSDAFREARSRLSKSGLLIFDAWYGPAVLVQKPTARVRTIEEHNRKIFRFVSPELDVLSHVVRLDYTVLNIEDGHMVQEVKDSHWQRFFFPKEIQQYAEENGFDVVKLCPFGDPNRTLTELDWYFTAVCRAR